MGFSNTPSTQSPTAWQRTKLAVAAGAELVGFSTATVYGAGTLGKYLTDLLAGAGASAVGFVHSLAGAVATTLLARGRNVVWSSDFGHLPAATAAANDTALVAAMTAVFNAGGGTVRIASGTYSHITVPFNWTAGTSVNIVAESGVYLAKSGATTSPILDFSADIGVLDIYSQFVNLRLVGNAKGHHGFKATRLASFVTRNLKINACDVGFESLGALNCQHHKPDWNSNNIGFRCRKSGAIYANLTNFFGGSIKANTAFGIDLGECNGVHFNGTDITENGTLADTATNGAIIRSTVDDEIGFSNITFNRGWFEANKGGHTIKVEAASGLVLKISNLEILSPESGASANIGAIRSLILEGIVCGSGGDTVTSAAVTEFMRGCTIDTLASTSTAYWRENVVTGGATLNECNDTFAIGGATDGVKFTGGNVLIRKAGSGLSIKSGANCRAGRATLVGGTVTVANNTLTANTAVFITAQADGGVVSWMRVNITVGTSFRIDSANALDTSTVAWMLVELA